MMLMITSCAAKLDGPRYSLAGILREYLDEYRRVYKLSAEQMRAVRHILKCRTAALGGRIRICTECGKVVYQYNPCKDRHCPQCGHFEKQQWLEAQKKWVLPIPYFHGVFTIDHVLNPLAAWNEKLVYDLLMRTCGEVLKAYGQTYLGGMIGITLVLHTWGQTLQRHLHVHCIITGGALVECDGRSRWQAAKRTFLFPVKKLSKDFRQRFCQGLRQLWEAGELSVPEGLDVAGMLEQAESQDWEVYLERPMWGVEVLLDYLGRYIFRIAISNHRIVAVKNGQVSFTYRDNRDEGVEKIMTLPAVEFIRRFLQHVLPQGFVRIRHYGLHHSSCRPKLQTARRLLGLSAALPVIAPLKLAEWLRSVCGEEADPDRCPACGVGQLVTVREFGATAPWRLFLGAVLGKLVWRLGWVY